LTVQRSTTEFLAGVHVPSVQFVNYPCPTTADPRVGCGDRAELVSGDFTCHIPHGGDVYILSRVLHD